MKEPEFSVIPAELNSRSHSHAIGELQESRFALKGLVRRAGHKVFGAQTIKKDYAYHYGGQRELQFNVGIEDVQDTRTLRFGVAFSLEPSQSTPDPVAELSPKIKRFNDFVELHAEHFADMRMWHYESGSRSATYMPGPIPWERVTRHVFIMLGKRQPLRDLDYEAILDDFDRLLPLYKYVESQVPLEPLVMSEDSGFVFRPGCAVKASKAVKAGTQSELDIDLRHNDLQQALYLRLVSQFGKDNVGTERPSGVGTRIDVVVKLKDEFWFYEIKTSGSPRGCLREAIGQLLEYSFWPGSQIASRLVIVGESALDDSGSEYLRRLKQRFSLPVDYEQVVV